ncbi:hypothetical protein CBL_04752 [Carabus blaptoides fortunei]
MLANSRVKRVPLITTGSSQKQDASGRAGAETAASEDSLESARQPSLVFYMARKGENMPFCSNIFLDSWHVLELRNPFRTLSGTAPPNSFPLCRILGQANQIITPATYQERN